MASQHLLSAESEFGQNQLAADQSGESFSASMINLAVDTLDVGADLEYDVCDTLRGRQSADGAGTIGLFAISTIDYPGTEKGWPCASEPPLFNAIVPVPGQSRDEFEYSS